ncbi:cell-division protein [Oceanobacillus iheyensis HTE831]|uniref:Cell division protein FtsX n=1 Tax=Oceanobacillus iheyensis (strain DSM 14371 / CIP 107618 / JCM 11309 / KCTC 3954 / HTE831) TaxID=221109 RepID=Q8ENJ1_OCEIH|nr:permease-like cell division protein FtsX [Oceanobacillus iheyensis]BAC14448.1 cell-division protein [Oceanobacillus iheyensis HTE831]
MKFRTLMRHIREGIKNIFRNGWMTFASVAAVTTTLILVAVFLALVLNLDQMATNIEEDVQISTIIDRTADEQQIVELGEELKQIDGVEKVQFSSRDDELSKLMDSMGEEGEAWGMFEQDNPLHHTYYVDPMTPEQTEQIASQIESLNYVDEVLYGQDVVQKLFEFNSYARTIGLGLIVALVFTAIFLISNTIKITIIARSTEIGIQKLVGAKNSFIRWPFFIEGALLGILGSIIPITVILSGYYYIYTNFNDSITIPFVELLPFNPFAWQLAGMVLLIGAVIGVWGSVMSVRKFLKV